MDICTNYEDNDEIILIGYSRGAFTVRCLIDLIDKAGLLKRSCLRHLHDVYELWSKGSSNFERFGSNLTKGVRIRVCAVWDTVNSTGGLHAVHSTQNPCVDNSFQALALHEHRKPFRPIVLRHRSPLGIGNLEQCWFVGYHGDIGGGVKDDALAHFALAWMMSRLQRFVDIDLRLFWEGEMKTSRWTLGNGPGKDNLIIVEQINDK